MELHPRLLVFLEHEMKQIIEDESRRGAEQKHALSVLETIEAEIQWEKETKLATAD